MEKLEKNLRKLRANREKVGKALLRTRYRAAYNALREEIKSDAYHLARWVLFDHLPIRKEDIGTEPFDAFVRQSKQIIREEKKAFRMFRQKLYMEYDIDGAVTALERVAVRIETEAYVHYQAAHCRRIDDRIWNDLIRMWWNPDTRCWVIRNNGTVRFRCLPPPPGNI